MTETNPTPSPTVAAPSRRARSMRGNFNSVKRPWATYWKRRALPPQNRWALRLIEEYVPSLVADKGGDSAVSAAELRVMETAAVARLCWALALAGGDLEAVRGFLSAERDALRTIGLGRRAAPVPSLAQLLAAKSAQPAAAQATDSPAR